MQSDLLFANQPKQAKRKLFRLVVPIQPWQNVFYFVANRTTSLGPIQIATSVNKNFGEFDVEVIDENNYRGPRDKDNLPDHTALQRRRADYVGFYGGMTSSMPRVFKLAKFYQQEKAVTIAGGDHVSGLPEEALANGLDIVVRGEGELAILEIIKALELGGGLNNTAGLACISGISWQQAGRYIHNSPAKLELQDLDRLPYPDYGLLRWAKKITFYPLSRTRGCSKHCEFCGVKGCPRWASAEHTLEDILWLVQTRKARYFFITDDRLNEDQAGTEELFRLIIKAKADGLLPEKVNFIVQIRLEAAQDRDFLRLMRRAGVIMVCIGYESPIAAELNAMQKGFKPEQMVKHTMVFKQESFWIHGMFIFGYPSQADYIPIEAGQRLKEFKRFIKRAKLDTVQVLVATPIPGTGLYRRLFEQGRIFPLNEFGWEYYDGNHVVFAPDPPLTPLDVQQGVIKLMRWFYSGWNFWRVPLIFLCFPLVVPLFGWPSWYRLFRNTIKGAGGHLIIRRWRKLHAKSNWLQKLTMVKDRMMIR